MTLSYRLEVFIWRDHILFVIIPPYWHSLLMRSVFTRYETHEETYWYRHDTRQTYSPSSIAMAELPVHSMLDNESRGAKEFNAHYNIRLFCPIKSHTMARGWSEGCIPPPSNMGRILQNLCFYRANHLKFGRKWSAPTPIESCPLRFCAIYMFEVLCHSVYVKLWCLCVGLK